MSFYRCYLCKKKFTVHTKDVHHKTPQAAHGTDDPDNLVETCPSCHDAIHTCAKKLSSGKYSQADDIARNLFPNSVAKRKNLFTLAHSVSMAFDQRELSDDDDVLLSTFMKRGDYEKLRGLAKNYRTEDGRPFSIAFMATSIITAHLKKAFPEKDKTIPRFKTKSY